jgi:ABC-type bacteriocin/lantibiotic exporter with double-glycine peptidase domain
MKKNSITKRVLKSSKYRIIFRFFSCILARVLVLLIPIFFGKVIELISKQMYNEAITTALIGVVLAISVRLMEILMTYTWHYLHVKLTSDYTDIALEKLFGNSIFSISRISTGEFLNIMNQDINVMASFFPDLFRRIVSTCEIIVIFIYFFTIGIYFGISSILAAIICFTIIFLNSKRITKVNDIKSKLYDSKSSIANEVLLSIKEIKVLNIYKHIRNRTIESTDTYTKSVLKQRTIEDVVKFSTLAVIELFRWGLLIFGTYLISKGDLELGSLVIVYNYYSQLMDSFGEFATINTSIRQFKVAENRFNKLIEYSRTETDENKIKNHNVNGDIVFENILYGYRDNPVLNDVSFKIKYGCINAITGVEGSGKSGILYLLLKLNRQHEGKVTINGVDINDIDTEEYFSIISSVDKEPSFFNVSIKENLSIVESNFEKAIELCRELDIHDEILKLKDGYDTIMSNTDNSLNKSIKTKLAIVRMLLKSPKIMIFDETFNSIDKITLSKIMDMLKRYKKDHTIIIMTRDINILEEADNIILLDKGKVNAVGTNKELLESNKLYRELLGK